MYVEMYGKESTKDKSMPETVHLKVRHESATYFKDGRGTIRQFRQKLPSFQKFEFNRFTITNKEKCSKANEKGNCKSLDRG